jgi:dienelactone hydrolase
MRVKGWIWILGLVVGVGHAFMNPNNRRGYNAEAAKRAWQEIYAFFGEKLK